jgi:outer membrane biosynthesis protein TonB
LTDDQKAMLRLLAQREEGYEDMAALMGISVEEVRERVKEALAEVEEPKEAAVEEPPEPAPPPPAPVPLPPPPEPSPPLAEEPPPDTATTSPAKAKPPRRGAQIPSFKVPKDRGALIGLGAGALVVVILIIVLIVGGSGGGSSEAESGPTASELNLAENVNSPAESKDLTQATLSASDGSEAKGQAIFGRFKKKVLLQVTGEGLEPSSGGESYAVWLSHSGQAMVPVGTVKVKSSGALAARFEIPAAVLVLVAEGAFDQVDVTRTDDSQLSAAIATARKTEKESTYTGTPVMSGKITGPLVGAAK